MNKIQSAASLLGSLGGKSTSPAKQAASRANGKRGGRPRHVYVIHGHAEYTLADAIRFARVELGMTPIRHDQKSVSGTGLMMFRDGQPYQSFQ